MFVPSPYFDRTPRAEHIGFQTWISLLEADSLSLVRVIPIPNLAQSVNALVQGLNDCWAPGQEGQDPRAMDLAPRTY